MVRAVSSVAVNEGQDVAERGEFGLGESAAFLDVAWAGDRVLAADDELERVRDAAHRTGYQINQRLRIRGREVVGHYHVSGSYLLVFVPPPWPSA